jgi:acyl dehydratase
VIEVDGPFFEDLSVGQVIDTAPALTLTPGHAALHQAIAGDRLRLYLDTTLAERVAGASGALAHPALVWDVAIGQSTSVTRRVIANLFYRGLVLHRAPLIGDTLRTSTEVVALRQNTPRPDRAATGLAVLRVRTVDQVDAPVLDFWRCAMLPLRDPNSRTDRADDLDAVVPQLPDGRLRSAVPPWDLRQFRRLLGGVHFGDLRPGATWRIAGGDVVSSAPELARLALNVAMAHHDHSATGSGRRLVYGGHTIALAASQSTRALPNLVTVLAWHGCDHLAPVHEGETLHSELTLEKLEPLEGGGGLVHLRSRVRSTLGDQTPPTDVLDWRFVGLMA